MKDPVIKLFLASYTEEKEEMKDLTIDEFYGMFNFHNFRLISNCFSVRAFLNGKIKKDDLF